MIYVVDNIVVFDEEKSVEARASQAASLLWPVCGNARAESASCSSASQYMEPLPFVVLSFYLKAAEVRLSRCRRKCPYESFLPQFDGRSIYRDRPIEAQTGKDFLAITCKVPENDLTYIMNTLRLTTTWSFDDRREKHAVF